MENDILKEQIASYRARSGEYEESLAEFLRANSDEGKDAKEEPGALERAAHLLQQMGTFERVLELACGTGLWTTNFHYHKDVLRSEHVTGKIGPIWI